MAISPKRYRSQFRFSMEGQAVDIFAKVTFGSTGAPTLNWGSGISGITRSSTGKYVIALTSVFQALIDAGYTFIESSGAPASPAMYVTSDASSNATAPAVTIQFNSAGTATDPGSGEVVLLRLTLRNSTQY